MQQPARWRPAVATKDAAGALRLNAGAYAFGLGVSQTPALVLA